MTPGFHSERRPTLEPGRVLARRFRIVRFLGRGGMGEVYEASDGALGEHVALKLIRPESRSDPLLAALLRDEVRKARSVSHPNVCRVFDLEEDEDAGILFATMELVRGESLHARLKRDGPLPAQEALPILRQVADGMDAIHGRGLLHLDLKPGNIMLESREGRPRATITDFGLAESRAPKHSAETTGEMITPRGGTPAYMAPERFVSTEPLTSAADVYSFGLVVYETLRGMEWIGPPGVAPPSLRTSQPGIPGVWDAMVRRCMSANAGERFARCGAALDLVTRAGVLPVGWRRWNRRTLAALATMFAVLAVAALFLAGDPKPSSSALRWYNQGVDAIRDGTYYKAVRALEQAVVQNPGYPLAHARLAEAWFELDMPERAQEEMLRASRPGAPSFGWFSRGTKELEAIHHSVTRDFEAASKDYQELAQSASRVERPRALTDLGRAFERVKQPVHALERYEAAIAMDPNYAGAYLRAAVIAAQLGQSDRSAQALARAEALYEASSNVEGVAEVYYQRGVSAIRQVHPAEALDWMQRARQSAATTRNPHQEIRAIQQLGVIAYQKGDVEAGQKYAEEAIRAARANNIEFLAGRGYVELANLLVGRGEFARAEEYYDDALRIARNYHNGKAEAIALYGLGALGIRTRVDEASARQVEQALKWFQANGYQTEATASLIVLERFQRDRGDLAAAKSSARSRLELSLQSHDEPQTALALSSVASILARQERFVEALKLTQEQLAICTKLGDVRQAGYAQEFLAELYAELGRFPESAAAAQEAESVAKKGGIQELSIGVAVGRARVLLLAGKWKETLAASREGIRSYEAKSPRRTRELLEVEALVPSGTPAERLELCQRSRKLGQGSMAADLSLKLTEAALYLEGKNPQRALEISQELGGRFEKQGSEYSVFRAALIEAMAKKDLQRGESDAAVRAAQALERFRQQFDDMGWEQFRKRSDFASWEKNFRQLRK